MPFYPDDASVPTELHTDEFLLRPLRAADVDLDYEAVMATQGPLRRNTRGRWPRPGFTLAENLADLEGHDADFKARRGFTYTVLDPSEMRCLGCVYVYPLEHGKGVARDNAAMVWFWIRPDRVADNLDRRLLAALMPWLRNDFAFTRVHFRTSATDERQLALLQEAGLQALDTLSRGQYEDVLFS